MTTTLTPCKFSFDYPATVYTGFSHGSRWNGFDNVAVTREVLDQIIADLEGEDGDNDTPSQMREIQPMGDGLYSLGWGYCTTLREVEGYEVEDIVEVEQAMCRTYNAWNQANGLNLGSADEHMFDENLTEAQRKWLRAFCDRWEELSRIADKLS